MKRMILAIVVMGFCLAFAGQSSAQRKGEVLFVAVTEMPLHEKPSGYSKVLKMLKSGHKLQAIAYEDIRRIPESSQPPAWRTRKEEKLKALKEQLGTSDKEIKALEAEIKVGKQVPTWVKVKVDKVEGYVTYDGLVPELNWADQTTAKAEARVKEWGATRAQHGAEVDKKDAEIDKKAAEKKAAEKKAKGGKGKEVKAEAKGQPASTASVTVVSRPMKEDYDKVDNILKERAEYNQRAAYNPYKDGKDFRKEGKLGEFKE